MLSVRLFFIGIFMGIADLIPGVSGGTIAFISGIYQDFLEGIKSLQYRSFKKIAWPFLIPLGCGMGLALLFFSKPLYYLMFYYPSLINAFFLGVIGGSFFCCLKKAHFNRLSHWIFLGSSFVVCFIFTGFTQQLSVEPHFFMLFTAGIFASCAMLLPGISGSYLLYLLGLYPLILFSLSHLTEAGSFKVLLSLGLGISLGLVVFSRFISWLLNCFYQGMLAILLGLMLGGLRSIWPFHSEGKLMALVFALSGFLITILLEIKMKKNAHISGV